MNKVTAETLESPLESDVLLPNSLKRNINTTH